MYSHSLSFLLPKNIKNVIQKLKVDTIARTRGKTQDFSGYENSDLGENMGWDINLFCLYMSVFQFFHVDRAFFA